MNEPRDTLVGEALRRLEVPEHGPEFWDRLESRFGEDPTADHPATDAGETTVVDLQRSPAARRAADRRRTPMFALAAAVALVVALVVGLAVLRPAAEDESVVDSATVPDDGADPETGAPVTPDPDAAAPDTTAPDATAPDTTVDDVPVQHSPEELATEWLTLLRDGEVEQAHALLDDASQEALPLESFREIATGLAEGAGSFADLESDTVPLMDDEGLAATAVVFTGDVEREGMIETASFAVVVTGDPDDPATTLGVGFSLDGPTVTAPATAPRETRTSPLDLTLSPTAGATWVVIDDSPAERIDTAGSGSATIDVEEIAGAGTHTVAVISTEGGLYTSVSYTVIVP